MSLTMIIVNQVVIMLLLIITGIICFRIKIVSEKGVKELSKLLLTVVNPVVILMAYRREFSSKLLLDLLKAFGLSVIAFIIAAVLSYLLIRKGEEKNIERFSCIYSNCGFMGIPLINAIFGYEGVFYLTAFLTLFNLLIWTHGLIQISEVKSMKSVVKAFKSPAVIAIFIGLALFLLKPLFPDFLVKAVDAEPLVKSLEYVAALNTPLAMIVAGATIAQTNVFSALKRKRTYWVCLIKLLLVPAATIAVFKLIPVESNIRTSIIIAMAAPTATMCTLFCIEYDKNSLFASELFAVTTLLSMVSLPLISMLINI